MFRIKICGIRRVEDAQCAVAAGADAVGLNFYRPSPRSVDRDLAQCIVEALAADVARVGVFVNHPVPEMIELSDQLGLQYLQLHGDEGPETVEQLAPRGVIRAFRCGPDGLQSVVDFLAQCRRRGRLPAAVLIDARVPGQYGGTGRTADWHALAGWPKLLGDVPLVLAGGLHPDNVVEAIRQVRPSAVDTASGVESAPGEKNPELVRAFVAAAHRAWQQLHS